jgi:hypothetical protein
MARRKHHHVYVIELHKDVLLEPRFRKNNPGYVDGKPCVYVGMTGQRNRSRHRPAIRRVRGLAGLRPMSQFATLLVAARAYSMSAIYLFDA